MNTRSNNLLPYLIIAVAAVCLLTMLLRSEPLVVAEANNENPLLTITVDVFSGRPNPQFKISGSAEITQLREKLKNLPVAEETKEGVSEFDRLGYRGIVITHAGNVKDIPSYIKAVNGKVKIGSGAKAEKASVLSDASGIEKYYLGLAKKKGLITDLIENNIVPDPDSL